jgi:hypothetical protein
VRDAKGGEAMSDKNPNRIGALWYPQNQSDNAPAAKGSIEVNGQTIKVVVWRNKWKQPGEKSPDLYIEIDQPREPGSQPAKPAADLGYGNNPASQPQEAVEYDDDLPF